MAIKADSMGIELSGSLLAVNKYMLSEPRRIGKITVELAMHANACNSDQRKILEAAGNSCPVKRSLHPDMELTITYAWT